MGRGVEPVWFATDDHPEARRLDLCRAVFGAVIGDFGIEPLAGVPFRAQTVACALPDVGLLTCFVSRARSCRGTDHCRAQAGDDLVLMRPVNGQMMVAQAGREVLVRAGDAVLVSMADPCDCDLSVAGRVDYLKLSRQALGGVMTDVDSVLMHPVSGTSAAMQLLIHYGGALLRGLLPLPSADHVRLAGTHIQDLVGLMFRPSVGPGKNTGPMTAPRRARLAAIQADIEARLGQRQLSAAGIARLHGITPRYVQKLFEEQGTTFSAFVLDRRLERARMMLCQGEARTISAIAYEAGFGDLSYFNRTFRRRFGQAPSAWRRGEFALAAND